MPWCSSDVNRSIEFYETLSHNHSVFPQREHCRSAVKYVSAGMKAAQEVERNCQVGNLKRQKQERPPASVRAAVDPSNDVSDSL